MTRAKKKQLFVDGHGDVREVVSTQFEIDWEKIKEQVAEAKDMVEKGLISNNLKSTKKPTTKITDTIEKTTTEKKPRQRKKKSEG